MRCLDVLNNSLGYSHVYKQGSFITGVLSAASAAHCGALWRMLISLTVSR